jgi:hypothetical protein
MKIFEPLTLKVENPKWINDPELGSNTPGKAGGLNS